MEKDQKAFQIVSVAVTTQTKKKLYVTMEVSFEHVT